MNKTIAITRKWQLHIPKELRHIFGDVSPGVVEISVKSGKLVIEPRKKSTIMDLAGSLHDRYLKNPVDVDTIRDLVDYSEA